MALFSSKLQCYIDSYYYDYNGRVGKISFPEGECCDMSGCIDFFTEIDPEVKIIQTLVGEKLIPDTLYVLSGEKWEATQRVVIGEGTYFTRGGDKVSVAHVYMNEAHVHALSAGQERYAVDRFSGRLLFSGGNESSKDLIKKCN